MKKLKHFNSILCDYVTQGAGNKHVLVNTYSSDVIVSEFPARFRFGLYFELWSQEGQQETLEIDVITGRKKHGTIIVELEEVVPEKLIVIAIPSFVLPVNHNTLLRVIARSAGFASTTVLKKKIYQSEINVSIA